MDFAANMQPRAATIGAAALVTGSSVSGTLPPTPTTAAATLPIGGAAPRQAQGAGITMAMALELPFTVPPPTPRDPSSDLISGMDRNQSGGKPSGFGEIVRILQERYSKPENDPLRDAARAAQEAGKTADEAIFEINRVAARLGLPVIPFVSPTMQAIVDVEGIAAGDPAGNGGILAALEMMAAWRSDP